MVLREPFPAERHYTAETQRSQRSRRVPESDLRRLCGHCVDAVNPALKRSQTTAVAATPSLVRDPLQCHDHDMLLIEVGCRLKVVTGQLSH